MICAADAFTENNFSSNSEAYLAHLNTKTEAQTVATLDRRASIGVFLITLGGITGIFSYLMGIVPMLAFGLSSFLIGIIVLYLQESGSITGSLVTDSILPSLLNIENLLGDLDLDEKGIYIPISGLGVSPKVFVPLALTDATKSPPLELDNNRIFVTVGNNPEDRGVLLEAPGSGIMTTLERSLCTDFATVRLEGLRASLDSGFRALGIAKVTSFEHQDATIRIEIELMSLIDLERKLRELAPRLSANLGTPVTSAAAASVSKATGKYVRIRNTLLDLSARKISMTLEPAA